MSPGITMSVGVNPDVFLTSTAYASSPSSSTFCEGESITFTASSTSAIATYTFMVGSSAVSVTTNNFYTIVPPLSSTTSVSVRVETAAGCTASQTLDMFLNDITSSGNIGQVSTTICAGETPPAFTNVASATGVGTISYQWQSRTFGTDFINVPVSATTRVYTETSALVTTTFYRRAAISTFGGKQCEEYSNVIEVKVGTPPISTLQVQGTAISAPATLTLCAGEDVTFVATGGTERLFYLDNNPLGVKSGSSTLSTSTLITGNRIKVETFDAIGCSSFSDEIVVQIVDNPIISLTSTAFASSASSSTFCEGDTITFNVTSTSAIATYTFIVGSSAVSVTTNNFYTTVPPLSSTTSVSVRVETAAGCTASQTLDMFLNEITSSGNIGQVSATICAGETPPAFTNVASATGVGTISYQWQSRTFGTDFINVPVSATTQVYTETSALVTTTFYRRAAISTFGGKQCEEYSNVIEVKVGTPPISTLQVQGTAISAPATLTLCAGEDVTFVATGGTERLFYLDNNPLGVKSGSSTLSTSTLITGNRIKVETFDAIGCSSFSDEIVVQIVDNPIISLTSTAFASSASSSTFCEGDSITFNVTSTSAIATYTFIVGSSAVSVTTNNFYTTVPPLSSTTSVSVRVETAAGCTASQTLDMFLNDITSSGNIGQVSTTICAGETPPAFTNVASATGVGTISYQWQSRTFGTDFINVPVSATTRVYTETSALGTTTFYRRAAISTFGGKQCEEYSNVIEVKVGTPPISTLQVQGTAISAPATLTLCAGEDVTFVATGGTERLFYLDNNPLGVKSGSSTLSTSTLITGNRIKVETFDAIGCSSFSDEIVVQIVDNPIISLTSTAFASSASSSTFCEGDTITFNVTSTSAIATYTFIVGSSAVSVTTNNFYTTVPPLSSTTSVSVRVETAAGCTASQTLDMFLNDITSSGNIGQVSTTICAGETPPAFTNVASATGVGTISYQWQSRTFGTDFINVPVSATTRVYTETSALGTTTFYRRAAISTFGGKQCEEYSNVIEVKVGTPPISTLQVQGTAISAPATLTLCAGEDVTFVATGGTERLFYLDNNPLGVKSGSSTLSTSTLITGNRIKVETFDAIGCSSFSDEIVVQIVDNPIISLTSTAFASSASSSTFCEGDTITFNVTSTSAIATYTFIVGSSAVSVTTNNFYTTVPPLSSTTSVSVRVETAAGCTASQTLDMFLNDITSSGNIGQVSTTICAGETPPAFTNVASATGVGTISYQWQSRTFATDFINVPVSATTQFIQKHLQ